MRRSLFCFVICVSGALHSQNLPHPFTQVRACQEFSRSVVAIETERGKGTGFIVSPEGWILTAAHVVVDRHTGKNDSTITITMPDGHPEFAQQVLTVDVTMLQRDFAILKVNGEKLPSLEFGDEDGVEIGSSIAVIGFPFSVGVDTKFCLFGTIAARKTYHFGATDVETVYFQGVSVKGISGSPVISMDTGKVIGIANVKLAGVNEPMEDAESVLTSPSSAQLALGNLSINGTIASVIDVLDKQLANGLGAATGINDPRFALVKAKRHYKPTSKK
jgi:serine protease Do